MGKSRSSKKSKTQNKPNEDTSAPRSSLLWLLIPVAVAFFYGLYLKSPTFPLTIQTEENYEEGIFKDWPIFEVVDIKGKGKGMIAARDIQQGECILQEKPLLTAPADHIPEAYIESLYNAWTPSQAHALLDLSWSHLNTDESINLDPQTQNEKERYFLWEAIIQNNAVAVRKGKEDLLGVFPKMARLNHACAGAYNMMYSWREDEEELRIYALKDVKKGEELLNAYIETRRPRDERIEHLQDGYGFTCTCPVCSLSPEESKKSDKQLSKFVPLYTQFSRWYKGAITGTEAISMMRDIWELSTNTSYFSERGRWGQEAAYVATLHGDEPAARQWLELGIKWASIEYGEDSKKAESMRFTLDNLLNHPEWESRGKLVVGGPLES